MRIATYEHKKNPASVALDVSWEQFTAMLGDAEETSCEPATCPGADCPHKDGPAWSPVDIKGGRANKNVRAVTLATLDLDHLTEEQVEDVARKLDPYRYVVHSTHQHAPPTDYRLRAVLPLTRPVKAA
jgi:hypothetical protein